MAVKLIKGNILDNWCAGNNEMILLVAHSHLLNGRYYLNNPAVAAVKNLIPDFYDYMQEKVEDAVSKNGEKYPYSIITYEENLDNEVVQRLGFMFTRQKWDKPPVPEFIKAAFDHIFIRIGLHTIFDQPLKPVMIQDPITSDIEMTDKAAQAVKRLYNLYPPEMQVWIPDKQA